MTLFPTKFENGKIEYKIRYKGRSRPFSRAKALVTSEQSRDPTKLKELLSQVLTITLDGDKGASSTDSSIELETRATRSSSTTRPRNPTSRSNKFKMLRGEGSQAAVARKQKAEKARRMRERMSIDEGLEYVRSREERNQQTAESEAGDHVSSEEQSESERLREERRTKKRNDPISSESEQGISRLGSTLFKKGVMALKFKEEVMRLRAKKKERR
ncbi:unnamed protein product [Microthlaspi erraticum]|uniref:Uncharacterized protein n=1 Tax=Microthlaspi erraticum TaxID=1685480 RepID=A0A6D2I0C6_9BRAS|nr:unnamed protein product [Microthlaspi erraticum]